MSMVFEPDCLYHVYNRGNNSQLIYFERNNYLFFLEKIRTHWLSYAHVISYCLMPNHFHFLVKTISNYQEGDLNKAISITLRSYTRAINNRFDRTGSLFQERTKSIALHSDASNDLYLTNKGYSPFSNLKPPDDFYPIDCFHYIHQNPIKAGLVENMEDWECSSFRDYAGLRNGTLPSVEMGYKLFSFNDHEDFIRKSNRAISD